MKSRVFFRLQVALICGACGLGLLIWPAPRARAAADVPVGMAAKITGQVSVMQGSKKAPLRLLGRLQSGAQVETSSGAGAVIVLFGSGQRFSIGAGQKVVVGAASVAGARALPALGGPSQSVVKLLGQARVGAALARATPTFQRLLPASFGYFVGMPESFEWQPIPGAATHTWTLFDGADNVIWSVSTPGSSASYPATALRLNEKRPYLWKLSGFSAGGKPLVETRWGIVTLLAVPDSQEMEKQVAALSPVPNAAPDAVAESLLLQAEVYRSFGALNRALETLDDPRLQGVEGLSDARLSISESLSPFARTLMRASWGIAP